MGGQRWWRWCGESFYPLEGTDVRWFCPPHTFCKRLTCFYMLASRVIFLSCSIF
jgi:hypothetical protein